MKTFSYILYVVVALASSCKKGVQKEWAEAATAPTLLQKISKSNSGIDFQNALSENDSINIVRYEYLYNGAGVGVGDFDNDGLPDIFFAGNQVDDRIYLNQGNMQFQDVSKKANIASIYGWSTGVSLVDINADGYLDIYVCRSNKKIYRHSRNLLWVNNGDTTFTEMAEAYGIADTPDATHAAFLDYDRDGDLDLYLLIDAYDSFNPNTIRPRRTKGFAPNTDILFENTGFDTTSGHAFYKDVSKAAGILYEGYGLGVSISDINMDGWPDIYVSNDYNSNDLLYMNQGDGTFKNTIATMIRHQATSSMGCDIADFNNDGLVDIMSLDMLPPDTEHQKLMFGHIENTRQTLQANLGYEPQFVRNMLQLHQGLDPQGEPFFSEIGQLSGVHATGWSWSTLFADFDNDGYKDIFVSNGIPKDLTNLDYIDYRKSQVKPGIDAKTFVRHIKEYMANINYLQDRNRLFINTKDLQFIDHAQNSAMFEKSCSNGAAYADFDNDGDLDLVTNNLNATASLYQNMTTDNSGKDRYLKIDLRGQGYNVDAIGAKIELYQSGQSQYLEKNPYRGFQSSITGPLHFGLAANAKIDSLKIVWPSGKHELIRNPKPGALIVLNEEIPIDEDRRETSGLPHQNAESLRKRSKTKSGEIDFQPFRTANSDLNIDFVHTEPTFNDFNYAPLLSQKYSRQGPGIAVGDIDGNGLDDVFIGGAYKQSGKLLLQNANGTFIGKELTKGEKKEEDMGTLLLDTDGDNDLDLYIVSGSSEYGTTSKYYQDRLYRNDGNGNFEQQKKALPKIEVSGSVIAAADYDKDGDLDLFRGGRMAITRHPESVKSFLLQNDNGIFSDVTAENAPGLLDVGMVTSCLWTDVDNDSWTDLIVVGEWMATTIFRNDKGTLKQMKTLTQKGFWNSISGSDFDNDGDTDYILGNLGLNTAFKASEERPLTIFSEDLNQDGVVDGILNQWKKDSTGKQRLIPVHPRNTLFEQLTALKKVYPDYASYASETTAGLLEKLQLPSVTKKEVTALQTGILENLGNFTFRFRPLPLSAQFAPVKGTLPMDVDGDGNLDIVLVGNDYGSNALIGQYDALNGLVLKGDGQCNFSQIADSGLHVPGDARALALVYATNKGPLLLATRNDTSALVFRHKKRYDTLIRPLPDETHALLTSTDGSQRRVERFRGASYLSQSSSMIPIYAGTRSVQLISTDGQKRNIDIERKNSGQKNLRDTIAESNKKI